MDSTTAVGLIVGLFTVSGTLGATFLSNMFQMRREREQVAREATSERNLWLRDEKKRIYLLLLSTTGEIIERKGPAKGITVDKDMGLKLAGYVQHLHVFGMEGVAKELALDFEAMLSAASGTPPAIDGDTFGKFNKKIMTMARKDLGVDG